MTRPKDEVPVALRKDQRRAYSFNRVAREFDVSRDTLVRAAQRGGLKVISIGGRRLIPHSEVERIEREGLGGI